MRNLSILIFLGILLCFPSTTGFASVALNDAPANHSHLIDKSGKLSKKERKRLARTKRWKKRKAYREQTPTRKKDLIFGIFGLAAALPFLIVLFGVINVWFIVLWLFLFAMTTFVSINFLINGTGDRELTYLNWEKFRHFALGWLLFIFIGYAAVLVLLLAVGIAFGGGSPVGNVIGVLAFVIAAVALLFLFRGIIRALSKD